MNSVMMAYSLITKTGIIGYFELTPEGTINGWAFDPNQLSPLQLSLVIDGSEVETTSCEYSIQDLLVTGSSQQNVGFHFEIPDIYLDGCRHSIQFKSSEEGAIILRDSDNEDQKEWTFSIVRETPIAVLDDWLGGDIHCWGVIVDRVSNKTRPADYIVVRQSGRNIATLFPTISRPDVASLYGCHHICGFVFHYYRVELLADKEPLEFFVYPDGREVRSSPLDLPILNRPTSSINDVSAEPAVEQDFPSLIGQAVKEYRTNGTLKLEQGEYQPIAREGQQLSDFQTVSKTNPGKEKEKNASLLRNSGLFDSEYYLNSYPDIAQAEIDPFDHFFHFGFQEGRWPNLYFDTGWYLNQNPGAGISGEQPLVHFLLYGDQEGYNPSRLFDVKWYRNFYAIPPTENTLAHYLRLRFQRPLSPLPDFDAEYYATTYPDAFAAKVDLFDHFFKYGYKELRNPSDRFDVRFYVQRYLKGDYSENPLVHFWKHRHEPGVFGRPSADAITISREVKRYCRPGPYFEETITTPLYAKPQALLLTYYLPQFHSFAENDSWWGKGFTEWTNLVRGAPRFIGHYQPRVPRDLGFYSLDAGNTMQKQIALALAAGVFGFVFYYYWFNGKRLMDQPVKKFLADPSLGINFALMWANENWTRRWDGAESEVLISQDYREGDDEAMAAEFDEHFKDSRYIRLQGRPLLMIYRARIIPNVKDAISRWRNLFRSKFNENPIFVMAQAFNAENPSDFGFDGAIEFPPHKLTTRMAPVNVDFTYLDEDFTGDIHRYDDVVNVSLQEKIPNFPLIKTAVPSWDNDARRQGAGLVMTGSTPPKYEAWLSRLVDIAKAHPFFGEPIVCVNAWNEWCEGAYLEPDLHFGGAYLNATARAISGRGRTSSIPRLILVGHDAFPSGAQHLLLNIGRTLKSHFGLEFEYLLLDGGKMTGEYAGQGPIKIVGSDQQLAESLRASAEAGFSGAIVNTTAAARAIDFAKDAHIKPILLVHELPRILREKRLLDTARSGISNAVQVVFPSVFVRDAVVKELNLEGLENSLVLSQGSYKNIVFDAAGRLTVRAEFSVGEHDHLIIGVGYADLRKGFDLFIQLWRLLQEATIRRSDGLRICCVWVGDIDPTLAEWLAQDIAVAEATGLFKMAGYRDDMAALFSAASAFVLTSREDPLPTVVMEAISAGAPVVVFEGSGGMPDLLREIDEGVVVPYGDTAAMARSIIELLSEGISDADRERRHNKIATGFNFPTYVRRLMKLALPDLVDVSVVVPNYNYANYMPERLGTIFQQTYPVQEILVLDDCSRDDSLAVIPEVAKQAGRAIRMIVNKTNSGSVFVQWRRAAEEAQGEFVWIAEADDLSDPDFISRLISLMAGDPNVKLAFSDSNTILGDGSPQWESYKEYYSSIEPGALTQTSIFNAGDFVSRFIAVKNLILNVSAVMWRRDALLQALDLCGAELSGFRMAGDWLLYLTALAAPDALVGYEAKPLNVHRRHADSVTHSLDPERHVAEIRRCHEFAAEFFALPPAVKAKQRDYLTEVTEQLRAKGLGRNVVKPRRRSGPKGK